MSSISFHYISAQKKSSFICKQCFTIMDWISLNHLSMSPTQQNTSVVIVVLLIPPDIPLQFWSKTAFFVVLSLYLSCHPSRISHSFMCSTLFLCDRHSSYIIEKFNLIVIEIHQKILGNLRCHSLVFISKPL